MTRGSTRRRGVGSALLGAVLAAGMVGVFAAPAAAHNYVVDLGPEEGSIVTTQPESVFVTTNDAVLDLDGTGSGSAIQVSGPSDAPLYYGDGCVTVAGATAQTTAQLGAAGEYTVTWQVVSTDGHPISDDFTFLWQPAVGVALADGTDTPPDCGGTAAGTDETADTEAADTDATASDDASSDALTDAVWIASALGAVALAVIVVLLVLRRRQ